jgi:predicted ATPase
VTLGQPLNNLPLQVTSFVGRERELAEIKRLFFQGPEGSRLITLTGTGGCGKTRLALQVAAGLVDRFADGVWFVDLASLVDPRLVPQVVATVLGLEEIPGRSPLADVADYLRLRSALLILDSCEHLVDACASVAETLLHNCPRLCLLVTSRETFSVAGENGHQTELQRAWT